MDTQNGWNYTGDVLEDPEPLKNDKTGEVQGHSVLLATKGEKIRFYVPAKVMAAPKKDDVLALSGVLKQGATGWAKATSATQAKKLNGAKAAAATA